MEKVFQEKHAKPYIPSKNTVVQDTIFNDTVKTWIVQKRQFKITSKVMIRYYIIQKNVVFRV